MIQRVTFITFCRIVFCVSCCLMAAPSFAQFQLSESFTTNSPNSNIIRGGAATLTAGTSDAQGDGWLRLTDNVKNQVGYCYINQSFPSDLGATIEFEFLAYTNDLPEADGFSIFLFDGSYGPGNFSIGQDGGALGYGEVDAVAQPTGWSLGPGVTGGYVGVGLDEFGNYSSKQTRVDNRAPGFVPQSIALRGPTSTRTTYLDGTRANLGGTVYRGTGISYGTVTNRRPSLDNYYRKVKLLILKEGANYTITVYLQISRNGSMQQVFGPTALPFAPPPTLKIGFAASTGAFYAVHEVRNLFATTPGGVHTQKKGPLSITNGDAVAYDVDVYNDATNKLTGVPFTDTLPAAFQYSALTFLPNGYAANTYDNGGRLNGRVFSGGRLVLAADSRSTLRFLGRAHFTDSAAAILRNIAYAKVPTGFVDPDVINDTAVFYSYRAPAIHPFTNVTLCDSGNIRIPVVTMNNARISWTATTTGSVTGAAAGNATANASGQYTFAPALHNTGITPAKVTYVLTPSYTYTSPEDGAPVEITGQPQTLVLTLNPRPVITPVADVSVCSLERIPQINFNSNISGATYAWTNDMPAIGLPASGSGAFISSVIAGNVTPTTRNATLTVTATANGCPSAPDTFHINVNTLTVPGFNVNNNAQCANDNSFTFTNTTTNVTAQTYSWDFGDGNTSTAISPTHTYRDPGDYPVKLVATNSAGCGDTITRNVTVYATPNASFSSTIVSANTNDQFKFTPNVSNRGVDVVSYHWDFGDGATSIEQSPTHTYQQNGTYTVTLTVTSSDGCTATSTTKVKVDNNPNLVANFTINNASQCLTGNSFSFVNTSTTKNNVVIASYAWDFGDGSPGSGEASPTHVYTTAGQYTVSLTVTATNGFEDVVTQTVTVNPVPDVQPVADLEVCQGMQVHSIVFTGSQPGTDFAWRQDNALIGITAANGYGNLPAFTATLPDQRVNHSTFTVTPSLNGCTGTPIQFTITVTPPPAITPVDAVVVCAGATTAPVMFSSPAAGTTFSWTNDNPSIGLAASGVGNVPSFTAVNNINTPQVAQITVTTSQSKCPGATGTSTTFTITVNPTPHLIYNGPAPICDGSVFSFNPVSDVDNTNITWHHPAVPGIAAPELSGTGNPDERLHNITNTTVNMPYTFTLTANGCVGSEIVTVAVKPTPDVISSGTIPKVCSTNPVNYLPVSTTENVVFSWTRNNVPGIAEGLTNGVGNINEVLTNNTDAPVTVQYNYRAEAQGCVADFDVAATIYPQPALTSALAPDPICSGTPFHYAPTDRLPGTSFTWNRNAAVNIANPPASGTGPVHETLVNTSNGAQVVNYHYEMTSSDGCSNTAVVAVVVKPSLPVDFTINDSVQCRAGNNFVFTRVPDASVNDGAWTWAVDDGTSGNGTSLTHSFLSPGTYHVTLSANNASGCAADTQKTVRVTPTPEPAFTYTVNAGPASDTYTFNDRSTIAEGNITRHQWDFGDGATSAAASPSHTYTLNGTYTVTLTVTSDEGCSATTTAQVVINKDPNIAAGFAINTGAQCLAGNSFVFTNTTTVVAGATITGYNWDFGDGTAHSTVTSPTHVYAAAGDYAVSLTVTATLAGNTFTGSVSQQVIVYKTPAMSAINDVTVCANTSSGDVHFQSADTAVTYSWTNDNTGIGLAASGIGNTIHGFIAQNTTNAAQVAHVTVTPSANGCNGPAQIFTITVLPQPVITPVADLATCPGGSVSVGLQANVAGTVFTWTNDNTAIGLAAAGTGNIPAFNTQNNTVNPLVGSIVVNATAAGCRAADDSFHITVNPTPQVLNPPVSTSVCDSELVNYVAILTPGATSTWTRAAVPGISNPAASGVDSVHEILHNTTNAPVTVMYAYTVLSSQGCATAPAVVPVTVNPIPHLTSNFTPPGICDSATFHYTPASNVAGASFAWVREEVNGISNPAAAGAGDPGETLYNTTGLQVNTVYAYTVVANGCHSTQNVTVPVNPTPQLVSDSLASAICSDRTFLYMPQSSTPGVNFSWQRAAVPGIAQPAAGGTGAIAELLTNTTATTVNVTYVYTLRYQGCTSLQRVVVPVSPAPAIAGAFPDRTLCAGESSAAIPLRTNVPGAVVYWNNSNPDIGLDMEGVGDLPAFVARNHTDTPLVATILLYAQAATGCRTLTPVSFTIAVNPQAEAIIIAPLGTTLCQGNSIPLVATGGDTYTWYRNGMAVPSVTGGVLNVLSGGTYTVAVNTSRGCSSGPAGSTVVTEVRKPAADFSFLGSCVNTPINFTSQSTTTGSGTVTYNWTDDAGHSATLLKPAFIYTAGGTYHMQLKVTPALCPFLADSITKPVAVEAPVAVINTPQGTTLCGGSTLLLEASGGLTYTWYNNGVAIAGATGNTLLAQWPGTYTVVATSASGCTSAASAAVTIAVVDKPVAAFTVGSGCTDGPITFTNQSTSSSAVTYAWSDDAGHTANVASPSFTYRPGNYNMQLTVTPTLCPALATSVSKPFAVSTPVPGMTLPEVNTVANSGVTLDARSIAGATYQWIPATGLSNAGIQHPQVSLTADQIYHIVMLQPSGCNTTDTLLVRVRSDDKIFIPNVITPNGDGANDKFQVIGIGQYPGSVLRIFNRWGNLVYRSDNYDNTWDGNGLNPGTYYYDLKLNTSDGFIVYKGWIQLIRKLRF